MKRLLSLFICVVLTLLFCGCAQQQTNNTQSTQAKPSTDYMVITQINHYVVEPDDKLHMTAEDELHYKNLMDAMLTRQSKVTLSESKLSNEYYIDLLRQSPYYYFLSECTVDGNTAKLKYAYSKEEQNEMLEFIDSSFLKIVNTHASAQDNTLDRILNIYGAVSRLMTYDHKRTDNKQLDSPLFQYPSDEIYKALKNKESVCYGFAYTLRFALLQLDIDCFCVYGPCSTRGEGHMWNIFRYDDKFYTCDSAWDRSDDGYARLFHFGKTDKEREADTLTRIGFSSQFFDEYGEIKCTDDTFRMFRGVNRYTWVKPHTYYIEDYKENEYIFDTTAMEMK